MKALTTQNLSIHVANKLICSNLEWHITPGSVWGILGPNGSGKTTLLQSLAGLHSPHDGQILLAGKSLPQYKRKELARSLGILFQHFSAIFPQNVADYCWGARYPHRNNYTLNQTLIGDALVLMELETLRKRCITSLSGGEKQRLAIASLLIQAPAIYLLDEPTNHLDIRHQIKVLQHFKQLALQNQASIVMAMHDINLAQQFCDYILLLFPNGEILHGRAEVIMTEANLLRLYQQPLQKIIQHDMIYWNPITSRK